jgi:hypothetical protein
MLAGMQLDVFTPLKDGPMTEEALAQALNVQPRKLRPLLYALINAELLSLDGDRFSNTQEAHVYLVRGRSTYLGNAHELYSDLWSATLQAGRSIRANAPQVKHDFELMSDKESLPSFAAYTPACSRPVGSSPPRSASMRYKACWMLAVAREGLPSPLAKVAPI